MRRYSPLLALIILVFFYPGLSWAQKTWGPHEVVDDSAVSTRHIHSISASVDAVNNRHVAWENGVTDVTWVNNIFYKRWEPPTEDWTVTEQLTGYLLSPPHFRGAIFPHMASDISLGWTFLTYDSEDDGMVINRSGVTSILDPSTSGNLGNGGSIAVEEGSGTAHTLYKKQPAPGLPFQLYYAKYTTLTGWNTPIELTSDTEIKGHYDVAVDRFGDVHVVWASALDVADPQTLYYRKYTAAAGSWSARTALTTSQGIWRVKIKADRHDPPYLHVVWEDNEPTEHLSTDIFYKSWRHAWSADMNLSDDTFMSLSPTLVTDKAGGVHIAWLKNGGGEGIVRYRRWAGDWDPVIELTDAVNPGWIPFITADWDENLYLYYSDGDRLMLRRYAEHLDSDGDGVPDEIDTCPADRFNDIDGDGHCGDVDNCPFHPNPGQEDSDGDGTGDACEVSAVRDGVDIVLVLDHSGSMDSPAAGGTMDKIALLKDSVELFVRQWTPYAVADDQIGVVYFESEVTQQNDPLLISFLGNEETIIDSVRDHEPENYTAMGGGLQRALTALTSSSNSNRHIILFTDGMQNCSPMVRELPDDGSPPEPNHEIVVEPVDFAAAVYCDSGEPGAAGVSLESYLTGHNITIHTVGTGVSTDAWRDLLTHIANETDGENHFTTEPDFDLNQFYTEHLVTALSGTTIELVDFRNGEINRGEQQKVESFKINRFAKKASFVLAWRKPFGKTELGMRILSPRGLEITPSAVQEGGYYRIATFDLPLEPQMTANGVISSEHYGVWRMIIDPRHIAQETAVYDALLLVDEPRLKYKFEIEKRDYATGDTIPIHVRVTENGEAIRSMSKVEAQVFRPSLGVGTFLSENPVSDDQLGSDPGLHQDRFPTLAEKKAYLLVQDPDLRKQLQAQTENIQLYDDGLAEHGDETANDGIYSTLYSDTEYPGSYVFEFDVAGHSRFNGDFNRSRRVETQVRIQGADVDETSVSFTVLEETADGRVVLISATPRDQFGNYLGPGYQQVIDVTTWAGTFQGPLQDKLDGSYSRELRLAAGVDPNITITVQGAKVFDDALSEMSPEAGLWSASFHLGAAVPSGSFSNNYDPGYSLLLDLEYGLNANYSVVGLFGYHRFNGSGVSDTYLLSLSGNLKYQATTSPWRPWVAGGAGVYEPESSSTSLGLNLSAGYTYVANPQLRWELGVDYHHVFTSGTDTRFFTPRVGVSFDF